MAKRRGPPYQPPPPEYPITIEHGGMMYEGSYHTGRGQRGRSRARRRFEQKQAHLTRLGNDPEPLARLLLAELIGEQTRR
ncbi:MAG TPA: hypothetical protein VMO26_23590 [Vicinamibacterales bacterium]|nr:hypothetical protein [Vicinamibacterales bacterium]